MDTGRLSQGQMIAAGAAVVLLISLFLNWIGAETPDVPEGLPGGVEIPEAPSLSGWESQNALDIYLLILAAFAIVPVVLGMTGGGGDLPFASAATTFLLAVIGVVLMFFAMFIGFPEGAERKIGMWLALLATIGIAVGGYLAMQDEVVEGDRY